MECKKSAQEMPEKQSHLINIICIEELQGLLCIKLICLPLLIRSAAVPYIRHHEKIKKGLEILMSFDTVSQTFSVISMS
jgi:hypothetical protein